MKIDLTSVLLGVGIALLLREQMQKGRSFVPTSQVPVLDRSKTGLSLTPSAVSGGPLGVAKVGQITSFFNTPEYLHPGPFQWVATVGPKPWNGYDKIFNPGLFRAINGVV